MPGSGPGGRWFKSIRPDHSFRVNDLLHTKIRGAPGCGLGHSFFKSFARNQSFSSEFSVLRREVHPHGESWFGEIKGVVGHLYRPIKRPVTMRLDADVIAWLKQGGPGYQTKANRLLRKEMLKSRRA